MGRLQSIPDIPQPASTSVLETVLPPIANPNEQFQTLLAQVLSHPPPCPVDRDGDLLAPGAVVGISPHRVETFFRYDSSRRWDGLTIMAILRIVSERVRIAKLDAYDHQTARLSVTCAYRPLDIGWDRVSGHPITYMDENPKHNPWETMGTDASWRSRTTVGVVSVANEAHFVTVAIFGPSKLVVVFDGAEGCKDHPQFWKVWSEAKQLTITDWISLGGLDFLSA